MNQGDLIEFRSGLFGIKVPNNLAIVLKRETIRKVIHLKIMTIKGIKKIKSDQVTSREFPETLEFTKEEKTDPQALQAKLKGLIKKYSTVVAGTKDKKIRRKKAVHFDITIDDLLKLWEWWQNEHPDEELMTTAEILEKYYDREPSTRQISQLDELLNQHAPKGIGYFDLVQEKPRRWKPLSKEEYQRIGEDIQALRRLRRRMIEEEIKEVEDEEGYIREEVILIPVELYVLKLSEEEEELLERIKQWMDQLTKEKDLSGKDLLGHTPIHTTGTFSLQRWLTHLAEDYVGEETLYSASAMTEFLFKTDYWTEAEALENLAKRAVKEHPSFSWSVDQRIQELALELPDPEDEPAEMERRTDLQDLLAYTVDPKTAKDFDQAISLAQHDDGTYTLWVHIADVAHYVKRGSLMDRHAKQRATSVYLPDRVLPMHPPALSTGLCALQEKVPRFAITVKMKFSEDGVKTESEIFESVVNVKANIAYEDVDEALADQNHPDHAYWTMYLEFGKKLRNHFNGLAIQTKEARLSSGPEDHGLLDMKVDEMSPSTAMNEMLMITTNETVAEYIRDSGFPGFYRCHAIPDRPDVERFNDQMAALGIEYEVELMSWPEATNESSDGAEEEETSVLDMLKAGGGKVSMGGSNLGSIMKPDKKQDEEDEPMLRGLAQLTPEKAQEMMQPFREVLEKIKDVDDKTKRMVMHLSTLGMFGRAYYTRRNSGHFGLGSRCYTHFTAPIRRYSDDIVHRILKGLLQEKATEDEPIYTKEELDELGEHCSDQTAAADKLMYKVTGIGLALMTRRSEWQGPQESICTRVLNSGTYMMVREIVDGRLRMKDLVSPSTEVIVDKSESIAFKKLDEDAILRKIQSAQDWQELLDEDDVPIEPIIRLGDKLTVEIISRDYVEGTVNVKPAE